MHHFIDDVNVCFGSLDNLKSTVSAAAMGMISSGWIWLVRNERRDLAAVPTFGAGTLIVSERRQSTSEPRVYERKKSMALGRSQAASSPRSPAAGQNQRKQHSHSTRSLHLLPMATAVDLQVRQAHPFAHDPDQRNNRTSLLGVGDHIMPLFCISVHEHAWMSAGYGVWGKEEYLKRFWSCLDWGTVLKGYEANFKV